MLALGVVVAAVAMPSAGSAAEAACVETTPGGGEWRAYGQGLSGDRYQPDEEELGPARVSGLTRQWLFSGPSDGLFQSTPIVADGCVFLGSSTGWVFAVDAETGKVVWKTKLPVRHPNDTGPGIVGAAVIGAGSVFVIVSTTGAPYAAALDELTGAVRWQTVLDNQEGSYADASPVVYLGMVFAGFNADESNPVGRGGYAILDAATGDILAKRYVIPDDDYSENYIGASIWSTAAVDPATGYAFVGTANPSTKREHERSNAIIKIDLDRTHQTFGDIVGSYKGTSDSYVARVQENPACRAPGPYGFFVATVECAHMDLDIGASPQLFDDGTGRVLVGVLQKSGVYHAADTSTMRGVWKTVVGVPCLSCNAATAATDGRAVYVDGVPPGQLMALDPRTGRRRWSTVIGDVVHFQSVTVAAGVVYTVDSFGFLDAFDARTGRVLLRRLLLFDTGDLASVLSSSSASLSVARHMVYVATSNLVIAYSASATT